MKLSSIPKSGRKGSVVYFKTRHGKVARQYVRPSNPRHPGQHGYPLGPTLSVPGAPAASDR
jgi:hypothetical protein